MFRFCFILLLLAVCLEAVKFFHKGRLNGGNLGLPAIKNDVKGVQTKWFEQYLHHFDPTNDKKWKQRYFVNDQYYNPEIGGPVFLMIGGEGEASDIWMNNGAWVNYGKKYGALLFQVEHRFYGKSHPTDDLSNENLKFLSSEQALADLATFIIAMNKDYKLSADIKWIAFGGSYPGSLAAWFRSKYSHLVHGSMSASGPLLAQVDFSAYYQVVTESLRIHSDECVNAVQQAIEQIKVLMKKPLGQQNINTLFNLCTPIEKSLDNPKDMSNFFENLADNIAGIVQYNKDNRLTNSTMKNITIDVLCNIMTDQAIGPAVNRLAELNSIVLNVSKSPCLDYSYEKMIEDMKNTSWASEKAEGSRQWFYQTCNEFGFYQSSTGIPQLFGNTFPVEFYIDQCRDIFGDKYNKTFLDNVVQRTNTLYGGLDIEVSNVVFVHGSIDPWHALGIIKTRNQDAPAIYINGTAHCANMYPPREEDLPELKAARVEIEQLIGTWLNL